MINFLRNFAKLSRIIIINIVVILIGICVFELFSAAYLSISETNDNKQQKYRYKNPNVDVETIAFYRENMNFRFYKYKAFVGWRAPQFSGNTINIDSEGFRRNPLSTTFVSEAKIHLFGGSTMWGSGVSDSNTIPSLISKRYQVNTINYGEQAYNSRQALNLFIDNIDKVKPGDVIVFFDGVNDVYHNCRSYNSYNGHFNEFRIASALQRKATNVLILGVIKRSNLYQIARKITGSKKQRTTESQFTNSCSNYSIARKVADFTIKNWLAVSAIAKSLNAYPLCILQPNPYTLHKTPHSYRKIHAQQISAVYPIIKKRAAHLPCFRDLSKIMKHDYYIDTCCHVNKHGNKVLSEAIWNLVEKIKK